MENGRGTSPSCLARSYSSLNILLINYEFPPIGGGAATAAAELARAIRALGHSVTVLTAGFSNLHGQSSESGVDVIRLSSRRSRPDRSSSLEKMSFVLHAAIALPDVVRRSKPDGCIVFFSLPCGPLGRLVRALSGAPYVISLRGGDVPGTETGLDSMHQWLAPVRRWILRGATAVVANSPGLKVLSERADPVDVIVVPNGVDTVAFAPARVGRPAQFRFLFVGRLTTQKNVAMLLRAVDRLRRLTSLPHCVSIIGDGPLAGELHVHGRRLGLEPILKWRKWVQRAEMPGVYASADCLVNPSLYEGMPNVVLEAMACGLPVIASEVAGNIDTVDHGVTGLLFPSQDAEALALAMKRVLEEPHVAAAWGEAGRSKAQTRHSWGAAASAYMQCFRRSVD